MHRGERTQTHIHLKRLLIVRLYSLNWDAETFQAARQRRKFLHESYFQSELTIKRAA